MTVFAKPVQTIESKQPEIVQCKKFSNQSFWSHCSGENNTTNRDKGQAGFSQCLITALLKKINTSTIIYHHPTAMKVLDYCLAGWRCSLVVLHWQMQSVTNLKPFKLHY